VKWPFSVVWTFRRARFFGALKNLEKGRKSDTSVIPR
jgi:hypothetical protein